VVLSAESYHTNNPETLLGVQLVAVILDERAFDKLSFVAFPEYGYDKLIGSEGFQFA